MPNVYSKLLAVGSHAAASPKLVYTVPAGHTAIVKQVYAANSGAAPGTLYLGTSVSSSVDWSFLYLPLEAGDLSSAPLWQVLPAGWYLTVTVIPAATTYYWISGSELLGVNDVPTVPSVDLSTPPPDWLTLYDTQGETSL